VTGARQIETVRGPVDGDTLGTTLVHEHLIADIRSLQVEPFHESREPLRDQPIEQVDQALLYRDPLVSTDNCRLADEAAAAAELEVFRAAGGTTVVECSSVGLGRDIRALQRVAAATEVNIVAPTGFYLWHSVTEDMLGLGAEELADRMVHDITVGIDGTGVRAGVIGEIGTSEHLHDFERQVLRGAAMASAATGAPISVHLDQVGRQAERVLEALFDGGAEPHRVVIGHLDQRPDMDREYIKKIAGSGVFLGLDTFGTTYAYDSMGFSDPSDTQRIELAKDLVEAGLGPQMVFSHDVGMKCMLRRHGGGGYAHLLVDLWPAMVARGIPGEVVQASFTHNPRRWLTGT
jgi:phosphotriesterase-related protein